MRRATGPLASFPSRGGAERSEAEGETLASIGGVSSEDVGDGPRRPLRPFGAPPPLGEETIPPHGRAACGRLVPAGRLS